MSNKVYREDSVEVEFDNNLVELNTIEDASLSMGKNKKNAQNHRKTS
jgi:hypothetical protein